MGIESLFTAAESARIQGDNLLAGQAHRVVAGLEFAAKYLNQVPAGTVGRRSR